MNKLIGYIIAIVGLAIIVLSFNLPLIGISLPVSIKSVYITLLGLAVLIVGVVLTFNKSSRVAEQEEEEVPIYSGEGKHRKIVGYRRNK